MTVTSSQFVMQTNFSNPVYDYMFGPGKVSELFKVIRLGQVREEEEDDSDIIIMRDANNFSNPVYDSMFGTGKVSE